MLYPIEISIASNASNVATKIYFYKEEILFQ